METHSQLHESARRLYYAAQDTYGDDAPVKVARRMNISAQTLQNWEDRGVSMGGALRAQAVYGCDANWLLSEDDSPMWRTPTATSQPMRLDPEILVATVQGLRARLKRAHQTYTLDDIEKDPARFIEAYELFVGMVPKPVPDNAIPHSPQGAKQDGRGKDVPVSGAAGRKMGKTGGRKA